MVEVEEKLSILLLQGRLRHKHFLLIEKERSRGHQKENAVVMWWVVQLLNRARNNFFWGVEELSE